MPRAPGQGNPLRRTSDRVQWWVSRIMLAVAIAVLPAAAVTGSLVYRAGLHTSHVQSATRHTVTAHLTADAPVPPGQAADSVAATATWTDSDGGVHTAVVQVWPGEKAGTPVQLWVGPGGTPAPAPLTSGQAASAGWTAAAATAGAASILCLAAWRGSLRLLDRHRYARWEHEWNDVEPHWSKRLPN